MKNCFTGDKRKACLFQPVEDNHDSHLSILSADSMRSVALMQHQNCEQYIDAKIVGEVKRELSEIAPETHYTYGGSGTGVRHYKQSILLKNPFSTKIQDEENH